MVVYYKEAKEALDSMIKVLSIVEDKLQKDEILEDSALFSMYQGKKAWVKEEIKRWEDFLEE
jgi:hypothetical protein